MGSSGGFVIDMKGKQNGKTKGIWYEREAAEAGYRQTDSPQTRR